MAEEIPQQPPPMEPDQVQVINPDGQVGMVPAHQLAAALDQGYQQATPEMVSQIQAQDKYGSTTDQLKTFGEGVGRGVAGPLFTGAEKAFGAKDEDIRGRQEANPTAAMAGEGTGLVGSSLTGVGEAALAAHAGEALAAHAIPEAGNVLQKIGSAAIKGAVENAVISSSDEVSKAVIHDPNQSVQTAITDIGLSGLLGAGAGGAIGAVNPLWEATAAPKARALLEAIQARVEGHTTPEMDALKSLEEGVGGLKVPDELKTAMFNHPEFKQYYQTLMESGTSSGDALRETVGKFKGDIEEQVQKVLGGKSEGVSSYQMGETIKNQLSAAMEDLNEDVSKAYEGVGEVHKAPLEEAEKTTLSKKILEEGSKFLDPGSPERNLFNISAERVGKAETIGHLKDIMSDLGAKASAARRAGEFDPAKAYESIRDVIRETENAASDRAIPGSSELAKAAREKYIQAQGHFSELSGMGKLGKVKSFGTMAEALKKIPSEKLADRMFNPENVRSLRYLKEVHPEIFNSLAKQAKLDLFEKAAKGKDFNFKTAFENFKALPKEAKEMMFHPDEIKRMEQMHQIWKEMPDRIGPSGTPRGMDQLWKHMPAGIGGIVGALTGHGPLTGLIVGEGMKALTKDIPDAVKLSLLKFLGSSGPVDASAWKTAADLIERTYKGQALITKASKAVFQAGKAVLPDVMYPDQKKTDRLDKKLKELGQNPEPLFDIGGKTAHYMPEHAQAMGQVAATAVTWLNEQRPKLPQMAPLDGEAKIPQEVQDHYTRTLQIAEQPLVTLSHLKEGTLLPSDVQAVQALYPHLYEKLSSSLVSEMIKAKSDGTPLPYKMTLGLSMFLAQPLDGTMTPQGIQSIQGALSVSHQQAQAQKSLKGLSATREQTPSQAREASKQV